MEKAAGTIDADCELFAASPACDAAVNQARRYIKLHELTPDDVKLLRGDTTVRVVTKKPINLKDKVFNIGEDQ
jgi:hypothetical protein